MSNTKKDRGFDPTPDELDGLVSDLLSVASHGGLPFMIIDAFGLPFLVETPHGSDNDLCIWYSASDRFVAVDEEQRIHWMHPDLETRIALVGVSDFYPAIGGGSRISELTQWETAETFDENAIEMLLHLKARQQVTDPIYTQLRSADLLMSPEAVRHFLEGIFEQAGLSDALGWSLAQIALRVPYPGGHHQSPHANPSWQAAILARLVDAALAPCPSQEEIRQALIALAICDSAKPSEMKIEIDCIARGLAHGVVPKAFDDHDQEAIRNVDRTVARIMRGDFDPKEEPADLSTGARPEQGLEGAIAHALSSDKAVSAHEKRRLIRASDDRLAALGHSATVSLALIDDRIAQLDEIPF